MSNSVDTGATTVNGQEQFAGIRRVDRGLVSSPYGKFEGRHPINQVRACEHHSWVCVYTLYVCAYISEAKDTGGCFMSSCNPATYLHRVFLISPDYHSMCGGEKSIYALNVSHVDE